MADQRVTPRWKGNPPDPLNKAPTIGVSNCQRLIRLGRAVGRKAVLEGMVAAGCRSRWRWDDARLDRGARLCRECEGKIPLPSAPLAER